MTGLDEAIFWRIYVLQGCLRSTLGEQFGVSPATVSRAVDSLLAKQLVVETGIVDVSRGRKPHLLEVNPRLATFLGLETDRDRVTAVVIDIAGNLLGRGAVRCKSEQGVETVIEAAQQAIRTAVEDAGAPGRQIRRIGVGHPGNLDLVTGTCLSWSDWNAWRNVPLRQAFQEALRKEVVLDDRSRAIALGERRAIREDSKHPNALYVNVGTGVGSGVFVAGQVYRGQAHAGEIGHLTLDKNGPLCTCGKSGCVEAYAAIPAVIRAVREALAGGTASLLRDIPLQNPGAVTIEMVVAAAGKGDRIALSALTQAAAALGLGITAAVFLLNPSLVVLCGRLARLAGKYLVPTIRQTVRQQCSELTRGHFEIRLASAKKDVAAVGCALLAVEAEAAILVRELLYQTTEF